MELLYKRHKNIITSVQTDYVRGIIGRINWDARLIIIRGPKGVGKSTLMQQHIKLNFAPDDTSVLYCSADAGYFSTHSLMDTAEKFVALGGRYLYIDEVHKYHGWSGEIKEMYDTFRDLHIVLSGSSLVKLNDGDADLSRRLVRYDMPGLSFREYLALRGVKSFEPVGLEGLLKNPEELCTEVCAKIHPLKYFKEYLKTGYYPYSFEDKGTYPVKVENVIDYIIGCELPQCRGVEVGNTRKIKALLQIISQLVPYEVEIAKISRSIGVERLTVLKYLKYLEEAGLITRLFQNLDTVTDLQKPDKILMDNPNLLYVLSEENPKIGTVRECFFCSQLLSAGNKVEYGGLKSGDFRICGDTVVEVGGADKGYGQIKNEPEAYIAADDIEHAVFRKIPLWAFGFLY